MYGFGVGWLSRRVHVVVVERPSILKPTPVQAVDLLLARHVHLEHGIVHARVEDWVALERVADALEHLLRARHVLHAVKAGRL